MFPFSRRLAHRQTPPPHLSAFKGKWGVSESVSEKPFCEEAQRNTRLTAQAPCERASTPCPAREDVDLRSFRGDELDALCGEHLFIVRQSALDPHLFLHCEIRLSAANEFDLAPKVHRDPIHRERLGRSI
jgi:hypothetical protein